ncbi:MAG: VOC family protein [Deltaproteobacteria bacterium]|nr:VOC family protein [Deltaproteobacteria bacterium]
MIQACSHWVVTAENVDGQKNFFEGLFGVAPYFYNSEFCEFVLPNKFRIAFFKPTGKASQFFSLPKERSQVAFGVTARDVEATYQKALKMNLQVSGPPKDHPWGEKSFLVIDPEGNRWEITQSPSSDGMLINK